MWQLNIWWSRILVRAPEFTMQFFRCHHQCASAGVWTFRPIYFDGQQAFVEHDPKARDEPITLIVRIDFLVGLVEVLVRYSIRRRITRYDREGSPYQLARYVCVNSVCGKLRCHPRRERRWCLRSLGIVASRVLACRFVIQ